jgi:Fe-S cluster assembly protein SufD
MSATAIDSIRNSLDSLRGTESWRYTNLKELSAQNFVLDTPTPPVGHLPRLIDKSIRLVVVNGELNMGLSDAFPPGISLSTLPDDEETASDNALAILQNHYGQPGYRLTINARTVIEPIIEIIHILSSDADVIPMIMPRHVINVATQSQVNIVEHHYGKGRYAVNQRLSIMVAAGGRLGHYRLQDESRDAWHLSLIECQIDRDAVYDNFTLTTGAILSRNEIHMDLSGVNAEGHLNGVYLLTGKQHADTTSKIDHRVEHGRSNQTHKGVIADHGKGVFQGKIHVHRHAQKTDGYQLSQALLLSEHAEINAKPELEIYADDVKCSHGATVGQLDKNALFYLRSRGIDAAAARALLVQSFICGALDLIGPETVRDAFSQRVEQWLLSLTS